MSIAITVLQEFGRLLKNTRLLRCARRFSLRRTESTPHFSRHRAPCIQIFLNNLKKINF
jgi:hypothetical protein